ncbi:MBL fold metallo-hydrolase [Infirmifilum sp. NZ]|uniref:MBL fold metallo-hydrolase n=1 Tax=Infirmifilum sp. NZ TaxID=2926850 RepID=UPI00279CDCA6|nr:MBL fold metallo-hydrolase [Infirmifilum sp. NZ]UNQ74135.1 MBL fold metallo-hydrolase [Infirmifilum sp. NZ]
MGSLTFQGLLVEHLKHATFRLSAGGVTIYIDPFEVEGAPRDGDIVICTHDHYDHCSPDDVLKVAKKDAVVIASVNCKGKVEKLGLRYHLVEPGSRVEVKGVTVEAVHAYNVNKRFHPREYKGVGVIVTIGGVRVYHAGDTDHIPEMKELKGRVDVALLPVSGTYVMTAEEAVRAALDIQPKLAIPMHYGAIVGSASDAERFKKELEGKVQVVII